MIGFVFMGNKSSRRGWTTGNKKWAVEPDFARCCRKVHHFVMNYLTKQNTNSRFRVCLQLYQFPILISTCHPVSHQKREGESGWELTGRASSLTWIRIFFIVFCVLVSIFSVVCLNSTERLSFFSCCSVRWISTRKEPSVRVRFEYNSNKRN